jgi:hypothetical protein
MLPEYKQVFLAEMDELRQQRARAAEREAERARVKELLQLEGAQEAPALASGMGTQYQGPEWREELMSTFYRTQHNDLQHQLNEMLNPEVVKRQFNMRVTQISEYSNAKYNNTVFNNPKHSSC